jgi:hypothetical protein
MKEEDVLMNRVTTLLILLTFPGLTGCSNALIGSWESREEIAPCNLAMEFEIEDGELTGDGDVCGCSFDVEAEDKGDDEYEIDFDLCDGRKVSVDCRLDDEELQCEDLLANGGDVTFERKD